MSDPPAQASVPSEPAAELRGRVHPVSNPEIFKLFVDVSLVPIELADLRRSLHEERAAAEVEPVVLRPAFDPDLYREGKVGEPLSKEEICEIVEEIAAEYDIPAPLFTRLIYQESSFRNETVSRAGALGIAQFMPETAAERGLDDPFDPLQALPASADFLRELRGRFGNFGLAAAAYNGGPRRVQDWLDGRGRLPKETRDYVLRITGRKAEQWAKSQRIEPHPDAFKVEDCKVRPIRAAVAGSGRNRR
ncbi:MAG: lytic transglycosylase domain-containing protein [Bradyrhizobiaceae bacterium]|nr:lytic transglycosylase domain-containing protein [Bradyrhizobiaceae bacterium]